MFKTNDRVVDICMGISFFIAFMYGAIMMFDSTFLIDRYDNPSSNPDTQTISIFMFWLGAANIGAAFGVIYMGYKGLDRAYFAYAVPLLFFFIIWNIAPAQASGNYTGIVLLSISLVALIVARSRSGFPSNPFDIPKADKYFGTDDMITKVLLFLGLIGQGFNVIYYFVRPDAIIEDTPVLAMSVEAQQFATAMMLLSLAWVISLLYQMRAGLSMTMISVGLLISTIYFVGMINYMITSGGAGGNPLIGISFTFFFVGSVIVFFRNQSKA